MYHRTLKKPDGRALHLYARAPLDAGMEAPAPAGGAPPRTHLRWHPLRGEWVAYASHRQHRTFLPPPEYNPLAPTADPAHPTEVPAGNWDVAVFDNRFPTPTSASSEAPATIVPPRPGRGASDVVGSTQDPGASLGALPLPHLDLVLDVWADRYRDLGARGDVEYVLPFENRGVEVGVTLHHPHGQIYAYPFVPPVAARELSQQRAHLHAHGRGLLEELIAGERACGTRVLYDAPGAVALVPVCARYPYEAWVASARPRASLADLDDNERADFARALKTVLLKYDGLWQRPFPYVLAVHQAPTDGTDHPEAHVHVELYPAYRMPGRLKYLAGSEVGAGVFTADTLPEDTAAQLRAVDVAL